MTIALHFDIPSKSDLKGLSIKTVLDRSSIRYNFLNGVPEDIKAYYKFPCFNNDPILLKWTGSESGIFTVNKYRDRNYNNLERRIGERKIGKLDSRKGFPLPMEAPS